MTYSIFMWSHFMMIYFLWQTLIINLINFHCHNKENIHREHAVRKWPLKNSSKKLLSFSVIHSSFIWAFHAFTDFRHLSALASSCSALFSSSSNWRHTICTTHSAFHMTIIIFPLSQSNRPESARVRPPNCTVMQRLGEKDTVNAMSCSCCLLSLSSEEA